MRELAGIRCEELFEIVDVLKAASVEEGSGRVDWGCEGGGEVLSGAINATDFVVLVQTAVAWAPGAEMRIQRSRTEGSSRSLEREVRSRPPLCDFWSWQSTQLSSRTGARDSGRREEGESAWAAEVKTAAQIRE